MAERFALRARRVWGAGAATVAAWAVAVALSAGALHTLVLGLGPLVAALVAALACGRAAGMRVPGLPAPPARPETAVRAWPALGLACALWSAGQAITTGHEVIADRALPVPSPADVGFLAFLACAIVGFVATVRGASRAASRTRSLLEATIITGSVLYISWALLLDRLVDDSTLGVAGRAVLLAYPVGDVVLLSLATFAFGRRAVAQHQALRWVTAGIAAIAVADSSALYATLHDHVGPNVLSSTAWFAGFAMIAIAGLHADHATHDDTAHATLAPAVTRRAETFGWPARASVFVPFAPLIAGLALGVVRLSQGELLDRFSLIDGVVIMAALLAHQVSTVLENRALTTTLESRVASRTNELAATKEYFLSLVQNSSDLTVVVDERGLCQFLSEPAMQAFGATAASLDQPLRMLLHEEGAAPLLDALSAHATTPLDGERIEWSLPGEDGTKHFESVVTDLSRNPSVRGIVVNSRDVTQQRVLQDQLRYQAFYDPLSGLPNRALFGTRVEEAVQGADHDDRTVGVLLIDLDGFKLVNDSLGHEVGDQLLAVVGHRLGQVMRAGETVARLGGDEFVVLVEDVRSAQQAVALAERVLHALSDPIVLQGRLIHVGASVGVATTQDGCRTSGQLLRDADTAMYAAKSSGKNRVVAFDPSMHAQASERLQLTAELRRALDTDQLVLHYQPAIDLESGTIEGVEALVRWRHPDRGLTAPDRFIPIAEDSGLIVPLGRRVLTLACNQLASWCKHHSPARGLVMAVNVSAHQLEYGGLRDDVAQALRESGVPPQQLMLEITESALVRNQQAALRSLHELKELGVLLAVDDFGTGYASLAYLRNFPLDVVKIDKSFLDGATATSDEAAAFLEAVLNLGHTLHLRTIAEGVEAQNQLELLRRAGCHAAQGFYFSKPVAAERFDQILRALPAPH